MCVRRRRKLLASKCVTFLLITPEHATGRRRFHFQEKVVWVRISPERQRNSPTLNADFSCQSVRHVINLRTRNTSETPSSVVLRDRLHVCGSDDAEPLYEVDDAVDTGRGLELINLSCLLIFEGVVEVLPTRTAQDHSINETSYPTICSERVSRRS